MIALLSQLKSWAWAICAALIGALLFIASLLAKSRAAWKERSRRAEDELDWQDDLRTIEVQNETKSKKRREQAKEEMADGKVPGIFKRHT